jgi:hypothetical protein
MGKGLKRKVVVVRKGKTIGRWIFVICGFFILTAIAEELPPPEKEKQSASEMVDKRISLAGKIIKVQFNRISYLAKISNGQYAGDLRAQVKAEDRTFYDKPGLSVLFPPEGLGFFSKCISKFGTADNDISDLSRQNVWEVYVLVATNAKAPSMALGDKCKADSDMNKYEWSVETEVPDLTTESKVSVNDVVLFPEQLNAKTVELVFYDVGQIKQKSGNDYTAFISCGMGHAAVQINFPAEGKPFFDKIASRKSVPLENRVYASIDVNPKGVITLQAKGRRVSSSGDEYKW